jgi:hypothetical protein
MQKTVEGSLNISQSRAIYKAYYNSNFLDKSIKT